MFKKSSQSIIYKTMPLSNIIKFIILFFLTLIKRKIPPKASIARNIQHPFAIKLDTNRTNNFTNSFIPMTSRDMETTFPPPITPPWNFFLFPFKNVRTITPCIIKKLFQVEYIIISFGRNYWVIYKIKEDKFSEKSRYYIQFKINNFHLEKGILGTLSNYWTKFRSKFICLYFILWRLFNINLFI